MFPKVQKGQTFRPSASMHNAVIDMLNAANGMLGGDQRSGKSYAVRITVINNTDSTLVSGSPVAINGCSIKDLIFEVRKVKKDDTVTAVILNNIEPQKVGSAVLLGIAAVKVTGDRKPYVVPKYETYDWQYQTGGGFPVLAVNNNIAVIFVTPGIGTVGDHDLYFASYDTEKKKIRVTGGYANCNGDWFSPQGVTELEPQEGIICLCAEADEDRGKYKQPKIDYAEPSAAAIALAKVTVNSVKNADGNEELLVSIMNYGVSTVNVIETANCPLASAASSSGD